MTKQTNFGSSMPPETYEGEDVEEELEESDGHELETYEDDD